MGTLEEWLNLLELRGSVFSVVLGSGTTLCPCRTEQGFRDDIWHKTDTPTGNYVLTSGTLAGTFSYSVRFVYEQGEKWAPIFAVKAVGNSIVVQWAPKPMDNPPSGSGKAKFVRIYRKREGFSDWRVVAEIHDLTQSSYTDNENVDSVFSVGTPIPNICNDAGFLPDADKSFQMKGFIQPVQSGAVRRLPTETIQQMFGEIKSDDHIGLIPVSWNGNSVDFRNWSQTGKDKIIYNGDEYTIVGYNLIAAPDTGNPNHHWEVGMRLIEAGA